MGKIKEKLLDFANLVNDYRWHMGNETGLDEFIQEQDGQHFDFYLANKDYIKELANEILEIENKRLDFE